uniref:Lectin n=1 Tax=Delia antiqua TaxID=265456 RepID=I3WES7_9MUSC|nr:lectin [Delia antiqua]
MKTSQAISCKCLVFLAVILKLVAAHPEWYRARDGHRYFIESAQNFNWLQAFDNCARKGLHFVTIDNARKNSAFVELLLSLRERPSDFWIGHHDEFNTAVDLNRSFFSSASGQRISYRYWSDGEPNNLNSNEHCVHVSRRSQYKWDDKSCDRNSYGYVCEKNHFSTIYQNDPAQQNWQSADSEENTQNVENMDDVNIRQTTDSPI